MLAFYMMLIDDEQNKSKFEQLYYEYRDRMMYVALSVLHNNEDSEDAVHNAFIGIAKNMDSIGEVASVQTLSYVLKATKNTAINMLGKNKRYETVDIENFDVVSDDDFFASLDVKERYNEVVNAIVNLDEKIQGCAVLSLCQRYARVKGCRTTRQKGINRKATACAWQKVAD